MGTQGQSHPFGRIPLEHRPFPWYLWHWLWSRCGWGQLPRLECERCRRGWACSPEGCSSGAGTGAAQCPLRPPALPPWHCSVQKRQQTHCRGVLAVTPTVTLGISRPFFYFYFYFSIFYQALCKLDSLSLQRMTLTAASQRSFRFIGRTSWRKWLLVIWSSKGKQG